MWTGGRSDPAVLWCGVWCGIWCVPGFGQDDLLARPGRGSRLALLHRHQVADIGEHRFEVRHLQPPPSGRHRIDTKYHTGEYMYEVRGGGWLCVCGSHTNVSLLYYQHPGHLCMAESERAVDGGETPSTGYNIILPLHSRFKTRSSCGSMEGRGGETSIS